MSQFNFDDGKYTVNVDERMNVLALRYKEPWRDLTGDKLVGAMLATIEEMQSLLRAVQDTRGKHYIDNSAPGMLAWDERCNRVLEVLG